MERTAIEPVSRRHCGRLQAEAPCANTAGERSLRELKVLEAKRRNAMKKLGSLTSALIWDAKKRNEAQVHEDKASLPQDLAAQRSLCS